MKIDGSMLSAYALGRQRPAVGAGDNLSNGMGDSGATGSFPISWSFPR